MKQNVLLLAFSFLFSFCCFAQNAQTYLGKSKIYMLPNWGNKYAGQVYDWSGDGLMNVYYFNTISLYDNGVFTSYSSSHGKYIAFQYFYTVMSGRYDSCEQVIFGTNTGSGTGFYAFTIQGNYLYIVDLKTDAIISTLDSNFKKGSDFSIVVDDPSKVNSERTPSFWIINNGYVKIYNGFPTETSVSSISAQSRGSEKKYNLGGVEIGDKIQTNGVYILQGKKYMVK